MNIKNKICCVHYFQLSAQILGAVILTSTVNPWLLLPAVIVAGLTIFIQKVFVKTSKNLKRIEGIGKHKIITKLHVNKIRMSIVVYSNRFTEYSNTIKNIVSEIYIKNKQ